MRRPPSFLRQRNADTRVRTDYRNDKPFKTVNSLLTLERDSSGKVVKHTEEWDHKRQTDSSDGLLGSLNEWRKKATADAVHAAL